MKCLDLSVVARSVDGVSRALPKDSLLCEQNGNLLSVWVNAELQEGFLGDESIILSLPKEACESYVAIVAHSPFWCSPFFGKTWKEMPANVQMLLVRTPRGTTNAIYPYAPTPSKRSCTVRSTVPVRYFSLTAMV